MAASLGVAVPIRTTSGSRSERILRRSTAWEGGEGRGGGKGGGGVGEGERRRRGRGRGANEGGEEREADTEIHQVLLVIL